MKNVLGVFLTMMLTAGCGAARYGAINSQRACLRGTGDLATTLLLENTKEENLVKAKADIAVFLDSIETFVTTGAVTGFTREKLTTLLLKTVPPEYTTWAFATLDAAFLTAGTTGTVGDGGRLRILAFVHGSRVAVNRYDIETRVREEAVKDKGG